MNAGGVDKACKSNGPDKFRKKFIVDSGRRGSNT